jgi:hypothetical protein
LPKERVIFGTCEEVLGDLSYDKKGDTTKVDYVMYISKKDPSGKITSTLGSANSVLTAPEREWLFSRAIQSSPRT